jgi:adenylate cyclase
VGKLKDLVVISGKGGADLARQQWTLAIAAFILSHTGGIPRKTMASEMTILFADVAGSVALHEKLGDYEAHRIVVKCLEFMSETITECNGKVVEIIGDEVMSLFSTAEDAFAASQGIQLAFNAEGSLGIRIGFHTGPTSFDNGHPYGDTVNVAARLAALAQAGQIVISESAQKRLTDVNQSSTRYFDRLKIKGKTTPYEVYEVLWGDQGKTTLMRCLPSTPEVKAGGASSVTLTYNGIEHLLTGDMTWTIGRTSECEIQIKSNSVSRSHVSITFHRGKILLQDLSTNGTYIRIDTGSGSSTDQDIYLHREEWPMIGKGILGLGEPIRENNPYLVYFECHS